MKPNEYSFSAIPVQEIHFSRLFTSSVSFTILIIFLFPFFSPHLNAQQVNETNISSWFLHDTEPTVTVNPNDPLNFVVAWMEIPFAFPVRVDMTVKATTDGGATWSSAVAMPHIVNGFSQADPGLDFDNNGNVFLSYVDYNQTTRDSGYVMLAKSTNGGINWGAPVPVTHNAEGVDLPLDRPWIAIDRSGGASDGTIYVTSMSAYWIIGTRHTWIKKSTDGGASFSSLIEISNATYPAVGIAPGLPTVGPDGKLYVLYWTWVFPPMVYPKLIVAVSDDQAGTFSHYEVGNFYGTTDSLYQGGYRISANPTQAGNLAVCWLDTRFGEEDVVFCRSTNSGQNWSAVTRLNDDPAANGVGQDMPWISYSQSGGLAAGWKDRRFGGIGPTVPFDFYAVYSPDGGQNWGPNLRMGTSSSWFEHIDKGNDHLGVAVSDSGLGLTWADFRDSTWEVYFSRATLGLLTTNQSGHYAEGFQLLQNFPNPCGDYTTFQYEIANAGNVSITITDLQGREIKRLVNKWKQAGKHYFTWDLAGESWDGFNQSGESRGTRPASGMYIYYLEVDGLRFPGRKLSM